MDNSEFNLTIIRLAAIFYIGWIMMSTKPAKQKLLAFMLAATGFYIFHAMITGIYGIRFLFYFFGGMTGVVLMVAIILTCSSALQQYLKNTGTRPKKNHELLPKQYWPFYLAGI